MLLQCPTNSSNEKTIWWDNEGRLVISGEIFDQYQERLSFNSSTGDLTIYATTLSDSGEYICGFAFGQKYKVNLTVKGK